jgi:uncharacterized membrane protein YjfL (UPF0719 family)
MSDDSYRRPAAIRYVNAAAYTMIGIAVIGGLLGVVGIEKHAPYQQIAVLMVAGWGALTILVVRIVDYAGRSAHASEEAAKSAKASEGLLRQLVQSQGNSPEA